MAPKKSKKKEDTVELPRASSLPDGPKTYFVGGWSYYQSVSDVSHVTQLLKPKTQAEEATVSPSVVFVNPGKMNEPEPVMVMLTHNQTIEGLLPEKIALNRAAQEKKTTGHTAQEEANTNAVEEAAVDEEDTAVKTAARRTWVVQDAVTIAGDVVFQGEKPVITVEPVMPETKAPDAKSKKKMTEEEKQRIAEERAAAEEEARRVAKAEEERLSQFAMPHRWPSVSMSNMAFAGRVTVRGAHVTFNNCHFMSSPGGSDKNLVEITQYARVSFTACTFAAPPKAALYCYPQSEVAVVDCGFSGTGFPTADSAPQTTSSSAVGAQTVGISAESAKLTVKECSFERLAYGIILRGRFAGGSTATPQPSSSDGAEGNAPAKAEFSSMILACSLSNMYVTGLLLEKATGVLVKKSTVSSCGYYAVQCVHGGSRQQLLFNTFNSQVRIAKGCRVFLHSNKLTVPLQDENDGDNVYMEPVY